MDFAKILYIRKFRGVYVFYMDFLKGSDIILKNNSRIVFKARFLNLQVKTLILLAYIFYILCQSFFDSHALVSCNPRFKNNQNLSGRSDIT